ncbi:hypothetical protein O181_100463 [Austropuccinia psidii MF-1]|uniref:Reverse transcriptase Ty1/copia-type domain-containing protein n=1 Tax=Austropuccinia psidii MF-1 TaxID=1389203 RepID=A0A9Q3PG59_9BASI|nr:hypothetical protein [Austropuccinia psidii MF-1]
MSVKYSHNVVFHKDVFPGHAFFNPVFPISPGVSSSIDIPPPCNVSPVEQSGVSPTPDNVVSSQGSTPVSASPLSPGRHLNEPPASTAVWPGWDIVVQPLHQKAPQDVSSSISSDKILMHKRHRKNPALTNHVVNDINTDITLCMPVEATPVAYALPDVPPKTYQQALVLADSKQWLMEIHLEKQLLEKKNVSEVVSTPPNVHLLNTVWVFKRVFDGDGNLVKHKACLYAQCSSQIPGLQYGDTYAPTRAMATLRLILLVGLTHSWKIHHMDTKTAFLNSTLSEDIYLWTPAGLALSAGKCYCLKKSIYGLKQSPRCGYQELVSFLPSNLEKF